MPSKTANEVKKEIDYTEWSNKVRSIICGRSDSDYENRIYCASRLLMEELEIYAEIMEDEQNLGKAESLRICLNEFNKVLELISMTFREQD